MSDQFFGKGIVLASGFDLGAKAPLDSRLVVNTIAERDAHVTNNRAYDGMIVYVKEDGKNYQFDGQQFKELVADIDLSEYARLEDVDQKIADAVTGGTLDLSAYAKKVDLDSKVDKVEGSRLMTEEEGTKLAGLENFDDSEIQAALANKLEASDIEGLATEDFVTGKIQDVVGAAPEALDTLKELADALGSDGDFASNLTNTLATKADKSQLEGLVDEDALNAKLEDYASADHNHDDVYLKEVPEEYVTSDELAEEGFLKEENISHLAVKSEVDEALKGYAPNEHIHSYNDLEDLPEIPSIEGLATVADENAREIFHTDVTTVNALGGIAAGANLDGLTVKDILNKLLFPYVAPTVSATGTPNGGTFEKGDNKTITNVRVVVNKKSEAITKIELLDGASVLDTKEDSAIASGGTFNFATSVSVPSVNKQLTAKVTDASGKVVSATTGSFNFVYPYYVGVCGEDDNLDEDFIKSLTKRVEAKGSKSVSYTCDYQCMVIAFPKSYGILKSAIDPNGFENIGSFKQEEVSITGLDGTAQAYYVYYNGASTVADFTMKFSH